MVGTVKGMKLWADDRVASEPTGGIPPPGEK
jgi:hypothetical protein